ncbi:hypothetical protein [Leptothoe spongobia]|uniref:CRISPR type III-associated protein domain-containing protein n=1 Tax=Leptothoe spongobia TAU-MAC 1115 TaxID=1967444 RepID=A0A947DJJ6_9CYAN|nr:hypothetical protein [Leptothoe spongobia]MBT9317689.1 hypothetical protein [Leptothoe spongobia TAU-MAC 1115]
MPNLKGLQALAQLLPDNQLNKDIPETNGSPDTDPEEIPMMYRAQIHGRCSLHYAGKKNQDLDVWLEEWTNSELQQSPRYQHQEPEIGWNGNVYRIKVEFPWRLFSNCGQDSIARPVIGKNGIPFIPGSSVKGLFRRICDDAQLTKYCGDKQDLNPSSVGFRFHGAYPIGDWCDRIGDVVHPQQPRQVEHASGGSAFALISLYKPQMIFEFSASKHNQVDWEEVRKLLQSALKQGIGGKTSTGYGMGGHEPEETSAYPSSVRMVRLTGVGMKSTLRTSEAEFRPNLFKATLRSHTRRLLGGVCSDKDLVNTEVARLFGGPDGPGTVQIVWQEENNTTDQNSHYEISGILRLCDNSPNHGSTDDVVFIYRVLQFAYTMGGFGKSWRRVWHRKFYADYKKLNQFDIGCHWESKHIPSAQSPEGLTTSLNDLVQNCQDVIRATNRAASWAESWHPRRVAVFSGLTSSSAAIRLFHYETFKKTIAIGGREPHSNNLNVSSVWHRMLPVSKNQYLEIVTIFYGNLNVWKHRQEGNQLAAFIQSLESNGLQLTWGTSPSHLS